MVARKIFRVILTLTIRVVGRLSKYAHTATASMFTVSIDILHSDHHRRLEGDVAVGFDKDHRTIADIELSSMVSNTNAQGKAERVTQPGNRFTNVPISKLRQYGASRY